MLDSWCLCLLLVIGNTLYNSFPDLRKKKFNIHHSLGQLPNCRMWCGFPPFPLFARLQGNLFSSVCLFLSFIEVCLFFFNYADGSFTFLHGDDLFALLMDNRRLIGVCSNYLAWPGPKTKFAYGISFCKRFSNLFGVLLN